MPLQIPNLDDKTYADLVAEARSLIPTYAPEWTNHNPSDPGITLIELFAYLTETLIYRLNRVTDENKVEFLKLLQGTEAGASLSPSPPSPDDEKELNDQIRDVVLEFRERYRAVTREDFETLASAASTAVARARCVPRRNLAAENLLVKDAYSPGHMSVVIVPRTRFESVFFSDEIWTDHTSAAGSDDGTTFALVGDVDQYLYVGLASPFSEMHFRLAAAGSNYDLKFEYFNGDLDGWVPLSTDSPPESPPNIVDETQDWTTDGFVGFTIPADWSETRVNGILQYWIRISTGTQPTDIAQASQVYVADLSPGGQVMAFDSVLLYDEIWTDYTEEAGVDDEKKLALLSERDQKLYLGMPAPFDNIQFQFAAKGRRYALRFEYFNGANWQPLTAAAHDLVDYTLNWQTDGFARFTVPTDWSETVLNGVEQFWVRISTTYADPLDDQPLAEALHVFPLILKPDAGLVSTVQAYLEPRRLITTAVHVVGARYVRVNVRLRLGLKADAQESIVRGRAVEALWRFLHPLFGGADGTGWPFGRSVYVSEIYELLDSLPGVDYVQPVNNEDELLVESAYQSRLIRNGENGLIAVDVWPNELVEIGTIDISIAG